VIVDRLDRFDDVSQAWRVTAGWPEPAHNLGGALLDNMNPPIVTAMDRCTWISALTTRKVVCAQGCAPSDEVLRELRDLVEVLLDVRQGLAAVAVGLL
jgi:hypothetical protein